MPQPLHFAYPQNTALGRRLSKSFSPHQPASALAQDTSNRAHPPQKHLKNAPPARRSLSGDPYNTIGHGAPRARAPVHVHPQPARSWSHGTSGLGLGHLPPIPGSPYTTEASAPSTPTASPSQSHSPAPAPVARKSSTRSTRSRRGLESRASEPDSPPRPRSKSSAAYRPARTPPQSLGAAVQLIAHTSTPTPPHSPLSTKTASTESGYASQPDKPPPPASAHAPATPTTPPKRKGPTVRGKTIGAPILNDGAHPPHPVRSAR